jgi:3-keto-disaccharide hydrolase
MNTRLNFLFLSAFLCLLAFNAGTVTAKQKWQALFNGKSTDAWRGFRRASFPSKCWNVEGGELRTIKDCDKSDRIDIITKDTYQDFELELEWRISPGGNSGIIYLVSEEEDETWKTGPEMQVLDDDKHPDGKNPKTSAGALYALIAPTNKTLKPVGDYNKVRLVVRNGHVQHWLNGRKVVEYDLGSDMLKELIAQSKFKDYPHFAQNRKGHVALQYHGDEVWYRNIRIRALSPK